MVTILLQMKMEQAVVITSVSAKETPSIKTPQQNYILDKIHRIRSIQETLPLHNTPH